jgi:hypothetical protein
VVRDHCVGWATDSILTGVHPVEPEQGADFRSVLAVPSRLGLGHMVRELSESSHCCKGTSGVPVPLFQEGFNSRVV